MNAVAQAWLVAVTTALGLPLGALAILMMHQLTGGTWGEEARPALNRISNLLPVLLLCGLPLIAAITLILPFLDQPVAELSQRVAAKLNYLQPTWIIVRTILIAGIWLAIWRLHGRSKRAAVLGYEGKWAIHPSQIELANEVFTPSEAEVTKARRILDAMAQAAKEGKGAVSLDGRLIDIASIRMAEALIEKANAMATV